MRPLLPLTLLLASLVGCGGGTLYRANSWSGGFDDTQLDKNVFRVTYNGTSYVRAEQVEELALLRSAELTLNHGFAYFVIVDGGTREDVTSYTTPVETYSNAKPGKHGQGVKVRTTTTGGDTVVNVRPITTYTIRSSARKPDGPGMVYDARFLCTTVGAKYKVVCGAKPA